MPAHTRVRSETLRIERVSAGWLCSALKLQQRRSLQDRSDSSLPIVRIRLVTALDPSGGSRDVLLDSENLSYEGKL